MIQREASWGRRGEGRQKMGEEEGEKRKEEEKQESGPYSVLSASQVNSFSQ